MAHRLRTLLMSLGLILMCGLHATAMADEVFICDGNKVLRVAFNKLDHMKRTNACVAAHFGLQIQAAPVAVKAEPEARLHKLISGPKRAKRPIKPNKTASSKRKVQSLKTAKTKTKAQPKKTDNRSSPLKVYRKGEALPVEEIAAKPGDYRNVRVLNAKSRSKKWHRHVY